MTSKRAESKLRSKTERTELATMTVTCQSESARKGVEPQGCRSSNAANTKIVVTASAAVELQNRQCPSLMVWPAAERCRIPSPSRLVQQLLPHSRMTTALKQRMWNASESTNSSTVTNRLAIQGPRRNDVCVCK
uniref:Uncharacterized protein n=1 Tax=Steinernema glaseri TaxID=37863 RepID=A0A1I7ZC47_9BILA